MEAWTCFLTNRLASTYMNAIYLIGLINQGMNLKFSNSDHIISNYFEADITLLCMHGMNILPIYCTDSKTLKQPFTEETSHSDILEMHFIGHFSDSASHCSETICLTLDPCIIDEVKSWPWQMCVRFVFANKGHSILL